MLEQAAGSIVGKIISVIINPLVTLGFIVAILYFLYGVAVYIWGARDEKKRSTGAQHMIWGIVGLTIMFTAFSLMYFIGNTGDKFFRGNRGTDGLENLR